MPNRLTRIWKWTGQSTQTPRRWTIVVLGGLIFLGWVLYTNGRADSERSRRDAAVSNYIATLSRWENAYNEHIRCIQRIDGRDASRRQAFENVTLVEDVIVVIEQFADIPADLDEELRSLFRMRRRDIEASLPPFNIQDCASDPGPAPALPTDIGLTVVELPDPLIVTSSSSTTLGD